jgi:hypothetical protein
MNAIAVSENELLHFRVPAARLVTEVDASFEKLFH